MSVQSIGTDTLPTAKAGKEPLATRMPAIVMSLARRIADEIVYTLREDFRHGRMSRDPKDWEL